ncbi:MAG: IS200/IS605 family transposase [Balneolaceae bacterium]|nr:MAG: IS200/IS605 family transposase [Balneolaceae bacterium]
MSWVQIWVHLVFSTKNRIPFFNSPEIRSEVFQHIRENAESKQIWIDCINGHKEHVHCLISLGKKQSISQVTQLIKGESSFWINKNRLVTRGFSWQDDYWAVSVSRSHLKWVRKYIKGQEEHHKKVSFREEVEEFMEKYGWKYIRE